MEAHLFVPVSETSLMRCLIILSLLFTLNAEAKRRVLITAFEPFAGRTVNGSQEVASLFPALSDEEVEYVSCILPVNYDEAAARARECFERLDPAPDMVISTGEGACNIQVETQGINYDNTPGLADNSGQVRTDRLIDRNLTPYVFLTLPVADMVCQLENPTPYERPNPSTWAGYFVCNNTAFHLGRYFEQREIPYGFVHLPNGDCKRPYPETAATFNQMIRNGIRGLESRQLADGRLPCEYAVSYVDRQISPLLSVSHRLCEEQLRSIASELLQPPRDPRSLSGDVAR